MFLNILFSILGCEFLLSLFAFDILSVKSWSDCESLDLKLILVD